MSYKLVIAEKPSVAQSIAKVIGADKREDGYLEGNGYIVSWCVGHLVELASPEFYDEKYEKWRYEDLPILPSEWNYQIAEATRKQFGILKKLMEREDVTGLVEATDAGREGELIFRLVYDQAKCKKPFERLWISSMEDQAISDGFFHLKNGREYDDLYRAALCRERADWIVGMNATRLFLTDTNRRRTAVKPMAVFLFRQVFKKSLSREHNRSGRKVISYIGCNFFMNSIDKKTWHVYNIKYAKKTWYGGVFMKKDEILNASRKEHRNKDLAEMEVVYQAGSHASRVGALVCCLLSLLSSVLAHTMIYSPWVIYFSIIATQWLVRFIKMKRKSDLVLTVLFFVLSILAFVGFVSHLLEVRI